jgi:hypothetical protein
VTFTVPPERVARVRDALEHLGMEPLTASRQLTVRRELLREVLTVAIDEVADALGGQATRLLRGGGSVAEVRAGVDELSGLLDLLESVERT